jgi:trehalose-6-phosphatase
MALTIAVAAIEQACDLTDECAFEWVNAAGGLSIAVGVERTSAAHARFGSASAARMGLQRLVGSGS